MANRLLRRRKISLQLLILVLKRMFFMIDLSFANFYVTCLMHSLKLTFLWRLYIRFEISKYSPSSYGRENNFSRFFFVQIRALILKSTLKLNVEHLAKTWLTAMVFHLDKRKLLVAIHFIRVSVLMTAIWLFTIQKFCLELLINRLLVMETRCQCFMSL
jgi:hypothetical protein